MYFFNDWLTYLLMPSDNHNSRTARARDFISSLINIASSQDVFFHQPQQLQYLNHGATFEPLCVPILYSQLRIGDNFQLAHNCFKARHKYCWNTSHRYNVIWNEFKAAEIGFHTHIEICGACTSRVNLPYFP